VRERVVRIGFGQTEGHAFISLWAGALIFWATLLLSSCSPFELRPTDVELRPTCPSDGGMVGSSVESRTTASFAGIWGSGSSTIAVGHSVEPRGFILRSTDGGKGWSLVESDTTDALWGVWGSGSRVIAVGHGGMILRSTDEGETWSAVESGITQGLRGVWGADSIVIAVGEGGRILRSTDEGETWSAVHSGITERLYGVWGADSIVVAVGDFSRIVRSTDGGETWSPVRPPSAGDYSLAIGRGVGRITLRAVEGSDSIMFAVGNVEIPGWVLSTATASALLRSVDRGVSWSVVEFCDPNPTASLRGIRIWGPGSMVVAMGEAGRWFEPPGSGVFIAYSTNLGASWTVLDHGPLGSRPTSFWMTNERSAVVVGSRGPWGPGEILHFQW